MDRSYLSSSGSKGVYGPCRDKIRFCLSVYLFSRLWGWSGESELRDERGERGERVEEGVGGFERKEM
jgi:hypothetical protein